MECTICKNGNTQEGKTTVTLDRNESVIVFRNVPAQICENCGEYFLNEKTSVQLYKQADDAIKNGAVFEVCQLKVA